jgi:cytoskeletal protein RodZ
MPGWGWALVAVGVLIVIGLAAWQMMQQRRRRRLQDRFGPEYDRTVQQTDSRTDAEKELAAREERRRKFQVRPLSEASRQRYLATWRDTQSQFVDSPAAAVASADALIQSVMTERGYPVEDFESRAADVSVDHPDVVQNYREGHRLAEASASGQSSTEDLRQAMRHYRALFEDLVGSDRETSVAA